MWRSKDSKNPGISGNVKAQFIMYYSVRSEKVVKTPNHKIYPDVVSVESKVF